jgi:preprotein translocase subunit SecA
MKEFIVENYNILFDDSEAEKKNQPYVRQGRKIKRNELCPCGSGKKYKHCHGSLNNTA